MHSGFLKIEFLLYFADFCDVTHLKQGSNLTFQGMPGDAQNLVLILPDTFLSNFALLFGSVQARLFEKLKAKGQKIGQGFVIFKVKRSVKSSDEKVNKFFQKNTRTA